MMKPLLFFYHKICFNLIAFFLSSIIISNAQEFHQTYLRLRPQLQKLTRNCRVNQNWPQSHISSPEERYYGYWESSLNFHLNSGCMLNFYLESLQQKKRVQIRNYSLDKNRKSIRRESLFNWRWTWQSYRWRLLRGIDRDKSLSKGPWRDERSCWEVVPSLPDGVRLRNKNSFKLEDQTPWKPGMMISHYSLVFLKYSFKIILKWSDFLDFFK